MKISYLFFSLRIALVVFAFFSFGVVKSQISCGFDQLRTRKLDDSSYRTISDENEREIQKIIESTYTDDYDESQETTYTIPVVFHLLNHDSYPVKSTSLQFYSDVLDRVNSYFNGQWASNPNIEHAIRNGVPAEAINTKIQFVFATIDPKNNPTDGVNLIDVTNAGIDYFETYGINGGGNYTKIFNDYSWPVEKYLNVFIAHKTYNGAKDVAGFASFGPLPSSEYAVYLRSSDSVDDLGDMFPHEVGHALGLYHTFQGEIIDFSCPANTIPSENGDKVSDTQPHFSNASEIDRDEGIFGLGNPTYNLQENVCVGENFDAKTAYNVMSYFVDYYIFTNEQKKRMRAVLVINNYEGFDKGISEIESGRIFARLVSQDRRCEAGFYNNQFKIKSLDESNDEDKIIWEPLYSVIDGDALFVATVDEKGLFKIEALNNSLFGNRWIANASACREEKISKIKLENKGTFRAPNCVLSVYREDSIGEIWNHTQGGVDVVGDASNRNPSIYIKDKRIKENGVSSLTNNKKLVNYDQIPGLNEVNYLFSPDKTKIVIKNGNQLETIEKTENCTDDYINIINTFKLD